MSLPKAISDDHLMSNVQGFWGLLIKSIDYHCFVVTGTQEKIFITATSMLFVQNRKWPKATKIIIVIIEIFTKVLKLFGTISQLSEQSDNITFLYGN